MEIPKLQLVEGGTPAYVRPDHWEDLANCKDADPEIFFPERGQSVKAAKAICDSCVVKENCLEANLYVHFGIYGGTSERERRKLRRGRVS